MTDAGRLLARLRRFRSPVFTGLAMLFVCLFIVGLDPAPLAALLNREPLREELRGFGRCIAVKRHHRRRDSWCSGKLRAPSIADGCDLYVVRAPANRFVEPMKCHVFRCPRKRSGMQFYADVFGDQAKPITKPDAQAAIWRFLRHLDRRIFFRVRFSTGFALPVHSFSTAHRPVRICTSGRG